jgi:hypothetical protein
VGAVCDDGSAIAFSHLPEIELYHSDAVLAFQEAVARRIGGDIVVAEASDDDSGASQKRNCSSFASTAMSAPSARIPQARSPPTGYRQAIAKGATARDARRDVLRGAGWMGRAPCGSPMRIGTIAIERRWSRAIPRLGRDFAFLGDLAWAKPIAGASCLPMLAQILKASPIRITASDHDAGAIEAARSNAERAGVWRHRVEGSVHFCGRCLAVVSGADHQSAVWERLGDTANIRDLCADGQCRAETVSRLDVRHAVAGQGARRANKARTRRAIQTANGRIPVRLWRGVPGSMPT